MTDQRVAKLLEDLRALDADRYEIVQALRQMVLGLAPSITEEVKYGGVLFSANTAFCGAFAYTQHVSLEFSEGAALPDVFKQLEGQGKFRRHIKLRTLSDIADKHVGDYLALAHDAAKG